MDYLKMTADELPEFNDDYSRLWITTWTIELIVKDFGKLLTPSYQVEEKIRQHKARETAIIKRLKKALYPDEITGKFLSERKSREVLYDLLKELTRKQ